MFKDVLFWRKKSVFNSVKSFMRIIGEVVVINEVGMLVGVESWRKELDTDDTDDKETKNWVVLN